MFIAFISFLAGIVFVLYPAYYCHKYLVNQIETEWRQIILDRFKNIPNSYHEAFEKGWAACAESESTIRMQYEKFFGRRAS